MTRRKRKPVKPSWATSTMSEWGLSRSQQRLLLITVIVVGLLGGSAALTFTVASLGGDFVSERSAAAVRVGEPRPDEYQGWASPAQFTPIGTRTADSKALTVKEVFGAKSLPYGKLTLKPAASGIDTACASAAWGEQLIARLAAAECRLAVRGVYVSADNRYVAQYTLFDLRDVAAANELVEALKVEHTGGWARALPAEKAAFPAGGHTVGSGHAMGHYVGLVWIGRRDGAEPGPKDDFVTLALAVRGAEKAVFRRVVTVQQAATPQQTPTPQ
jgi:hypothetical protein